MECLVSKAKLVLLSIRRVILLTDLGADLINRAVFKNLFFNQKFLLFTCTLLLDDNFLDESVKLELFWELIHLIFIQRIGSKIDLVDFSIHSRELCNKPNTFLQVVTWHWKIESTLTLDFFVFLLIVIIWAYLTLWERKTRWFGPFVILVLNEVVKMLNNYNVCNISDGNILFSIDWFIVLILLFHLLELPLCFFLFASFILLLN